MCTCSTHCSNNCEPQHCPPGSPSCNCWCHSVGSYQIWWVNHGYFADRPGRSLQDAVEIARAGGFEARIDGPDGKPVGSWDPISGWRPM